MPFEDTIIALSTAPGAAARGVIRLSGPLVAEAVRDFFQPFPDDLSSCLVRTGEIFPCRRNRPVPARLFFWPEGRGYTGLRTVEIHTLGSPPILDAVVAVLCRSQQIRLARPGEFTLRAFLAGRIDLTQAEAVLGVIDARDHDSLTGALSQLAGGISVSLDEIREPLVDALAHLEAGLDFADEDIDFITPEEIRRVLDTAWTRTDALLQKMNVRGLSDDKPLVVLAGPPNSGKSTLFNKLLADDRAIVSSMAGTTRDYLEAETVFHGIPLKLVDTAGGNEATPLSDIDGKSVHLSRKLAARADLRLECREAHDSFPSLSDPAIIRIRTKTDLRSSSEVDSDVIGTSSHSEEGIERLRKSIADRLRCLYRSSDVVPDTARRCRDSLTRAFASLDRSRTYLLQSDRVFDETILASEIRDALNHLDEVDGSMYSTDLLDRIFSRFCIGK